MSQLNQVHTYNALKSSKKGDLSDLTKSLESMKTSDEKTFAQGIFSALDLACKNDIFLQNFSRQMSINIYGKVNDDFIKKFRPFTGDEKEAMQADFLRVSTDGKVQFSQSKKEELYNQASEIKDTDERLAFFSKKMKSNFAIDSTGVLETNVLPIIDGLIKSSDIMNRVSILTATDYKRLVEFGPRQNAERLAKAGAGTPADFATRTSLTLDNNQKKIQSSTTIHERDLMNFDGAEWANFISELGSRISYDADTQICFADNTGNSFQRGLYNTVGSDSTNMIGALTTDVSAGTTNIDKLMLMSVDMSKFISLKERSQLVYLISPTQYEKFRMIKDTTGNYMYPQDTTIRIGAKEVLTSPVLSDSQAFLTKLSLYQMIVANDGFSIINDNMMANFLEGIITYKTLIYADGAPRMAFKRTVGGVTDDNKDRNFHRYTDGLI